MSVSMRTSTVELPVVFVALDVTPLNDMPSLNTADADVEYRSGTMSSSVSITVNAVPPLPPVLLPRRVRAPDRNE
jgi:hypothetical protein